MINVLLIVAAVLAVQFSGAVLFGQFNAKRFARRAAELGATWLAAGVCLCWRAYDRLA